MMDIQGRLFAYTEFLVLFALSLCYLPITILTHPILLITSPAAFRSKWFENLWRVVGPKMAASPLQVNHIESLLSRSHGVVLELGPGGGDQAYHFRAEKIERMYGAEPNEFLHDRLLQKSRAAGLKNYTVLHAAAQPDSLLPALRSTGLIPSGALTLPPEGIFDSIVAIKTLCSVPQGQLQATVAVIQALLKPGGEFVFFEHLGNNSDQITQIYVWFLNWIWPAFIGGCRLDSRLDSVINTMCGWGNRSIQTTGEYKGYEIFRYATGICQKMEKRGT